MSETTDALEQASPEGPTVYWEARKAVEDINARDERSRNHDLP